MAYLLTQIVFSLVLAGLLGAVVGWLVNGYRAADRQQSVRAELMRQSLALSQAETDNKMIEDDFRELKQRSEETIALLTEDTNQIPSLKKNLEKSQTLVRQLLQKHDAELRHVQAENRLLASKMRDLENREKAVTRLQMDLNTERLKMRTQGATHDATRDTPQNAPQSATQSATKGHTKPPPVEQPVPAENIVALHTVPAEQDQARSKVTSSPDADSSSPGLQAHLPLETEESPVNQGQQVGSAEILEAIAIDDTVEVADEPSVSNSFTDTDTSFDDILDKADDVLTRFQDDPSSELESFQIELDQELDAIRRDLAEDASTEPPVLHKAQITESAVDVNSIDQELLDQLGTANVDNDLQTIFGIGPVTEKTLKSIGIRSFAQIAQFKREHIEYVAEVLQIFPGRIERDNWVASARKLVASNPASADKDTLETSDANPELEDA